jgi:PAS domain S-box-containing protein
MTDGATSAKRVLLAERDAETRQRVGRVLAASGYEVIELEEAHAVLETARTRSPAAMLLNITLSHLSGASLLGALRKDPATAAIPIIYLRSTTNPNGAGASTPNIDGADASLELSAGERELVGCVSAQIELARVRRESAAREAALKAELAAAREQLDRMRSGITDQIITLDAEFRYVFVNDRVVEATKLPREQLLGRSIWELFPGLKESEFAAQLTAAFREQRPREFDYYYPEWKRWFENRVYPTRDGITLFVADITARRMAEDRLRESEEFFRSLMEQAPFSVQVLSPDGRTLQVNQAWEQLWGLKLDRLHDYNVLQDPQLEAKGVLPWLRRAFAGESVQIPAIEYDPNATLPGLTQNGDPKRWVTGVAYPLRDAGGKIHQIVLLHEDITARRRAELGLRESEQRFRRLVEANIIGIITANERVVSSANDEFLRMVGYTRDDLEHGALRWPEMTPPHYAPLDARALTQLRERGWCDPFEKELFRRDGSRLPILIGGAAISVDPPSWVCFVLDQSARKESERALRESEERFRTLFDGAPLAIAVARNGVTLYTNAVYGRMFGLGRPQDVVGRPLLEQIAPEDHERVRDYVRRRHNNEPAPTSYEMTGLRADGSRFPLQAEVAQLRLPDGAATIAFLVDLTDKKKSAETNARLAAIVASSDDAIIGKDLEGVITSWNRGAERLFGYTAIEAIGQRMTFIIPADRPDEEPRILKRVSQGLAVDHLETVRRRKDGSVVDVSITVSPIKDARGTVIGVSTIARDISDQKRLEERLEATVAERTAQLRESNEQLEAFVYSIAHDLRAPLRSMTGYSQLLVEEYNGALAEPAQHMLKRIQASSLFMDKLLLDLLAYGRAARAPMELGPVSVDAAWQAAVFQNTAQIERTSATLEAASPLGSVIAHEATLGQCLANLLSNALKFTAEQVAPRVLVRTEDRGATLRVWIEDNGLGIPPEHHERIFRVFERMHGAKYPGTGIGLSIVRKGIERMGGHVGLESTPGRGSRFFIELRKA